MRQGCRLQCPSWNAPVMSCMLSAQVLYDCLLQVEWIAHPWSALTGFYMYGSQPKKELEELEAARGRNMHDQHVPEMSESL